MYERGHFLELFLDEANRRNISYTFKADEKYLSFNFDHNELEIIVLNILSNAFKFTANGESICLTVKKTAARNCQVCIEDNGKGIPVDDLEKIFERFYRGREEDTTTISGTGIGLSFVKELTELHGGTIQVESDGKNGSKFIVDLPPLAVNSALLNISADVIQPAHLINDANFNTDYMNEENNLDNQHQDQEQPIILVVEDEGDMLQYIYEILSPSFTVVTASNGKEGLEKDLETIPDLIVSDVMMPEMDGIELCKN